MRNLVAAAVIAALATPAAGWETIVTDDSGGLRVELWGYESGTKASGIVVLCYPDTADFALIFAREASKDYSVRRGAAVTIELNDMTLAGELMSNDSKSTAASATVEDLPRLLAEITSHESASVRLLEVQRTEMILPIDGLGSALSEFRDACGV